MTRLRNLTITHRRITATAPLPTLHNSTVDVTETVLKPGNNSVRVNNALVNFGYSHICVDQKFRLRVQDERSSNRPTDAMERTLKT